MRTPVHRLRIPLRLVPLAGAVLCLAAPALAGPTFTVNSTLDIPGGGDLADGVCETAPGNGVCTLRAAVMEGSHVPGGGATVRLAAATYPLTRAPGVGDEESSGDLDVAVAMTIEGVGASASVIEAGGIDRILDVTGGPVIVRGIGMHGGHPSSAYGGCVQNAAELAIEDALLSGCLAMHGAGIANNGTGSLSIARTVLDGNETDAAGLGGGVYNETGATLHVEDSAFENGIATGGAGVATSGTATIERTVFRGNQSGHFYGDNSYGAGGAIDHLSGSTVVVNSSLIGNRSFVRGGGISASSGSIELVHVTITGNLANVADQLTAGSSGGGIYAADGAAVMLRNSIVAENAAGSLRFSPNECAGSIVSGDYNRIGARGTCTLTGATAHVNATNLGTIVAPLAPTGGFAATQSPLEAPAIPLASCSDALGAPLTIDGRGYTRDASGACDIGAISSDTALRPSTPMGVELLPNSGAAGSETGVAPTGSEKADPPFWSQTTPGLEQLAYGEPGGFPAPGDAPPQGGSYFFAGGFSDSAWARQRFDLRDLAAAIDAGSVGYRVSGFFGGYAEQNDRAYLELYFLDDNGAPHPDEVTIGGFDAADRGNVTKLLFDSARGTIPTGTRTVEAALRMSRAPLAEPYNDGYADELSLVLPEPAPALACATLSGVAAHRSRRPCRATIRSAARSSDDHSDSGS